VLKVAVYQATALISFRAAFTISIVCWSAIVWGGVGWSQRWMMRRMGA
jgi:hypothetical protein